MISRMASGQSSVRYWHADHASAFLIHHLEPNSDQRSISLSAAVTRRATTASSNAVTSDTEGGLTGDQAETDDDDAADLTGEYDDADEEVTLFRLPLESCCKCTMLSAPSVARPSPIVSDGVLYCRIQCIQSWLLSLDPVYSIVYSIIKSNGYHLATPSDDLKVSRAESSESSAVGGLKGKET